MSIETVTAPYIVAIWNSPSRFSNLSDITVDAVVRSTVDHSLDPNVCPAKTPSINFQECKVSTASFLSAMPIPYDDGQCDTGMIVADQSIFNTLPPLNVISFGSPSAHMDLKTYEPSVRSMTFTLIGVVVSSVALTPAPIITNVTVLGAVSGRNALSGSDQIAFSVVGLTSGPCGVTSDQPGVTILETPITILTGKSKVTVGVSFTGVEYTVNLCLVCANTLCADMHVVINQQTQVSTPVEVNVGDKTSTPGSGPSSFTNLSISLGLGSYGLLGTILGSSFFMILIFICIGCCIVKIIF
jgi:hypothetical protein